jgi:hypothetical protein
VQTDDHNAGDINHDGIADLLISAPGAASYEGNCYVINVSLTSFLQEQVDSSQINFRHDGSVFAPSYSVSFGYSDQFATKPPMPADITFLQSFALINNQITINQGQALRLNLTNLSADDFYNLLLMVVVIQIPLVMQLLAPR